MKLFVKILLIVLVELIVNIKVVGANDTFINIQKSTTSFLSHNETQERVFKNIERDLKNCCQNEQNLVAYRVWGTGVEAEVAKGGTTVLGKYPDYINLASELNARRFNIPTHIWNKMTSAEQWAANVKFLDRTISRGDKIILSNPVKDISKVGGYFRKELDYLMSKGYKLSSNGTHLIK